MTNRLRLKTASIPLPCGICGTETRKLYPLRDKHVCYECWDDFIARNEALHKFNDKHRGYYHCCEQCFAELTCEERETEDSPFLCAVCKAKGAFDIDGDWHDVELSDEERATETQELRALEMPDEVGRW